MAKAKQFNLLTVWLITALVIISLAVYQLYSSNKAHLYDIALEKHYKKVHQDIENIIADRRASSITLALALAENAEVKAFLCEECVTDSQTKIPDFQDLINELSLHTEAGKLWIQIIDDKGFSRFRSWTNNVDDYLRDVRYDVRKMLSSPDIQTGMSVGRFSLTYKSMVPVKDENNKLIGMLEVITKPDSFTNHLKRSHGNDSLILVDSRFRDQLIHSKAGRFIEDLYIGNTDAQEEYIKKLLQLGSANFTEIEPIRMLGSNILTQYIIQDSLGRLMGYWFIFDEKNSIDTTEIRLFKKQFMFAAFVIVSLILLLMWIAFIQHRTVAGKHYYQNIINSTSEIIIVSEADKIIEANKRFFDFFSEYKSIAEFSEKHRCICDIFVEEDGLLTPVVGGKSWRDYILDNPNKMHVAKIYKQNEEHYFDIKVAIVEEHPEPIFTIIMHDVTQQISYQRQLEKKADMEHLTGVLNRTTFNRLIKQETARSLRYKHPLCLIVLDIDGLQDVNNKHGFAQGDKVLIRINRMIKSLLRDADSYSRISGSEFAILMSDTQLEEAKEAVQRIQYAFENLQNELSKKITMNVGMAELKSWENQEILFKKADNALQIAKQKGLDEVVIAEDTPKY